MRMCRFAVQRKDIWEKQSLSETLFSVKEVSGKRSKMKILRITYSLRLTALGLLFRSLAIKAVKTVTLNSVYHRVKQNSGH